jgi:isoleucyl-tRNA synthetase
MDFKETLNLPKTDFSMKANLPKEEPKMLEFWQNIELDKKLLNKYRKNEKFILHDGPPYANGNIHIGTAYNKILKDIIPKYKWMRGYNAYYVPGWDTHGMPIEHKVSQELNVTLNDIDPVSLRKKCQKYAEKYIDIQREEFKRLGVSADWENPYLTFLPEYEEKQIDVFGKMYERGYIYKGLKPVLWCPSCETALAAAEIEYSDEESDSIYVKFKVIDDISSIFPKAKNGETYVVIWTTTPWTIPGNFAITFNPDFSYSLVKTERGYLILASKLVEQVMKKVGIEKYQVIAEKKGDLFEGIKTRHPLLERDSIIILGRHVTLEEGSGCVHTAPGHGQEDYEIGIKYKLPIISTLDSKGRLNENAGPFNGLYYKEANTKVIESLQDKGYLLGKGKIKHSYPHCWRCKNPVLFRATEQWFVSVDKFRDKAIEAINQVKWVPSWGKDKIYSMVQERTDWCISRQRVWGVPIPAFYCKNCKKIVITPQTIDIVKKLFREKGSNAWFAMSAEEILPKGFQCPYCQGTEFEKESDIMDVWFDSGCSHAAVLRGRDDLHWPCELYLEGTDQHRGWFQTSLLTAVASFDQAPYKSVLTHGFIVDEEGRKMSKSIGNVIPPQKVIDEYGADILRLWVASSDYKRDVRISNKILKQLVEIYRKIRNTARFILGNLYDFDPDINNVPYDNLEEIDKLALSQFQDLVRRTTDNYDNYEFHTLYHDVHNYCTLNLSSFYLDIIKDRLYVLDADSLQRRAAQTVLYTVITGLTQLIAPVLSFTAEEIWQKLNKNGEKEESIFLSPWPKVDRKLTRKDIEEKWSKLLAIRKDVLKALEISRKEGQIGNSLQGQVDIYTTDKKIYSYLKDFKEQLEIVFIVSKVNLIDNNNYNENENIFNGEEVPEISVVIKKAPGQKCERCWCYSETVGEDSQYPTICQKCVNVLRENNQSK